MVGFHWQKIFDDGIFVIFDKFWSIKGLPITRNLVNVILLVVGKLTLHGKPLADGKPLVVRKKISKLVNF